MVSLCAILLNILAVYSYILPWISLITCTDSKTKQKETKQKKDKKGYVKGNIVRLIV